jgi:hypothetical protein
MPLVQRLRFAALLIVFFITVASTINAQNRKSVRVKDMMTPQQFRAAGLTKLTSAELAALDAWVDKYSDILIELSMRAQSPAPAPAAPTTTSAAIESQIDGDFNGWEGETIFKLTNGQIWQQAEYDYEYEYAFMPEVTIYKTSACWKMKVEGMDDTVCVKRLK